MSDVCKSVEEEYRYKDESTSWVFFGYFIKRTFLFSRNKFVVGHDQIEAMICYFTVIEIYELVRVGKQIANFSNFLEICQGSFGNQAKAIRYVNTAGELS